MSTAEDSFKVLLRDREADMNDWAYHGKLCECVMSEFAKRHGSVSLLKNRETSCQV